MSSKFLRTDWMRFSRLGKNRKKKQVWRRARGKHSKIRRKRFGYPAMPTVGYQTARKEKGKIEGLIPIRITNLKDLSLATKDNIIILGRVGAKKKLELIKKAEQMKIKIQNLGGKK
jgi:large subunit ribosomal protein L32e